MTICCSAFLPPSTAQGLTLCSPVSVLKAINQQLTSQPVISFLSLSFLTTLQPLNPLTFPSSWMSVLSWLLNLAFSMPFFHLASICYKGLIRWSVLDAQCELTSGLQNWVGARLRHQESPFSEMSSFLNKEASFLDLWPNQTPLKHKHTWSPLLLSSCLLSSFPLVISAILFGDEPQVQASSPELLYLSGAVPSQPSILVPIFPFNKHLGLCLNWGSC